MSQNITGAEEKALALLGNGHPNHVVARATGLSDSRISQLLSEDWFSARVNELKYKTLLKHNELDETYDAIESTLAKKLEGQLGLMFRPAEIVSTLSKVNAMKRRGVSSPDNISTQQPALALVMPTVIIQHFTKTVNNQVVEVGDQPLVTIQPGQLQRLQQNGHESRSSQSPQEIRGEKVTEAIGYSQPESSSFAFLKERLARARARQSESLQLASEH